MLLLIPCQQKNWKLFGIFISMFQTKDVHGKGSKFLKVFQGFLGDPGIFVQKCLFCAHIDVNRKKKKKKKNSKRVKQNQRPFFPHSAPRAPLKRGDFRARFQSKSTKRSMCAGSRVVRYFRMIQKYQFIIASFDLAMKPSKMA